MNRYTIYCTEEQTKKALELGAPIERDGFEDRPYVYIDGAYLIPTAEQMLGWLYDKNNASYTDYKKAILVGIDAALEYLSNSLTSH